MRRATPADLADIQRLAREVQVMHVAARPDVFRPEGAKPAEETLARLAAPDHLFWLAHADDGRAVGYAYAHFVDEPPSALKHPARVLSLEEIGVTDDRRGAGIGLALMQAVHAAASAGGADRVVLSVWSFNAAAIRFYERLGFATFQQRMALELRASEPRDP